MVIDNVKISNKVIGVISILALTLVAAVTLASLGMTRMARNYSDLSERLAPAVLANARANRALYEYAFRAYALAMEESEEENRRAGEALDKSMGQFKSLFAEASRGLPEDAPRMTEIGTQAQKALDGCAAPVKLAAEVTEPLAIIQVGHRLRDECAAPLTKVIEINARWNDELIVRSKTVSETLSRSATRSVMVTVALSMLGLAVAVAIGLWVARRGIAQPVHLLSAVMERFARDDLDAEVPGTARGDELGAMARTVQVFKQNALEGRRMESRERDEIAAREKRAARIAQLTQSFDSHAASLLGIINTAAGQLKGTAQAMSATAEQTTRQAGAVSSASDEASANVQTVATAAEELTSSIQEISRQVDQSANVARAAATEAETTNRTMQGLAESSARIGEVVSLINDIASQTNLLALNATIEAARAGDAGKGFAVVAGEVKTLANQTARATEEIGQQVGAVQSASTQAVQAIGAIVKRIDEINMIATAISSAVEEQSAATGEIARNIQAAAQGTEMVSANIGGVSQAAGDTRAAADEVLNASESLITQSGQLGSEVSAFLSDVRAA